jgi:putative ABC transport system permease protein
MLKNYIKVAFRNIRRYKVYSLINLVGLAVGLAACVLILLWVQDELSYDRFHENSDDIYLALEHEAMSDGRVLTYPLFPAAFGPALENDYPEVLETVRLRSFSGRIVRIGETSLTEDGLLFADPELLRVFSFPLVVGDRETALKDPGSILITRNMAAKYFGDSDPLGQIVEIDGAHDFRVTGILENLPSRSHVRFDFVVPISNLEKYGWNMDDWRSFGIRTYALLREGTNVGTLNGKIENIIQRYDNESIMTVSLQPLKRIHLYSAGISAAGTNGDIKVVILFSLIALLILLMACVNFMNLTTARSDTRAREVGLRKVVGAKRSDLIFQFFGESIVLAFAALAGGLLLVQLVLPAFNSLAAKSIPFPLFSNALLILGILGLALATGLIAGSYPALYLSAMRPIRAFRRISARGSRSVLFRKILVVSQFVLTICLVLGTIVVHQQMTFVRERNLGFDKEHVLCLNLKGDLTEKYQVLKDRILGNASVLGVAAASDLPAGNRMSTSLNDWEGRNSDANYLMDLVSVDQDYLRLFGLELVEGRFFRPGSGEEDGSIVVNETAVKAMDMKDPLGKRVRKFRIIGVVKDFHFDSLHKAIAPLALFQSSRDYDILLVKIRPENISRTLASIQKSWTEAAPGYPFDYRFLEDSIAGLYRNDQKVGRLINVSTLLALLIACLGLFGMASFTAERRTKEIGIRKILGASVPSIFVLLSSESFKWVLAANLIAWPLAHVFMTKWLSTFAFRISLNILYFVVAAAAALFIAFLTICYQTLKAAVLNPVHSLRHE